MLKSQTLALRASEIKVRLVEIAGAEGELGDEVKTELTELRNEAKDVELRWQAATTAEGVTETVESPTEGTPEQREVVELRSKSSVSSYVNAAVEMRSVEGPEAEYNAALGMGMDRFPLALLAPEKRQTTNVDVSTKQNTWLDRLFDGTAAQRLGVTFSNAGPGVAAFPVTTAGATAEQQAKSEAATAAPWTISVTEMRPKRNAVHAVFSIEDVQRIGPGLEDALQRDLRSALVEGIDRSIFKGDSGPSGTDADIVGFQKAGISEFTLTQANKVKGDKILEELAAYIDGRHAGSPADLRIVASVGTNILWMTKLQAATVDNMTVAQFLRASGIDWTTRGNIDTNTANGDFGAYLGLSQGIAGAAQAAFWESASMIRDPYSGATKGEVGIVLNTLWDFAIPRTSNFKRLKYVT